MPHDSNPLQVLVATLDEVERLNRGDQAMEDDRDSNERGSSTEVGTNGREGQVRLQTMYVPKVLVPAFLDQVIELFSLTTVE